MTDPLPEPTPQRHPSTVSLSVLLTLTLLALAALGWLWYTRYAPLHFDIGPAPTITDARDATWILPIVFTGIFLIALAWIVLWLRMHWELTALPLAVGIFGVLALVFAGREAWVSANTHQPITIAGQLCDAGSPGIPAGADQLPEGCEPAAMAITIGTPDDPAIFATDATGLVSDLPHGTYTATLAATLPPETSRATLTVQTGAGILSVSRLERIEGETWTGRISIHPDLENYHLLVYPSPYPDAQDAAITFTAFRCVGMSPANVEVSDCDPVRIDAPVMEELPPSETEPGRPPEASVTDGIMTLTRLEARSYTLVPTAALVAMTGDTPSILVISASEPPVRENSILQPGDSPLGTLTIEIQEQTGPMDYVIYIFDDGQTVARATGYGLDMRPYPV